MRIGVHFNCQNDGIAESLRALLPDAEVINYISATGLPEIEQAARAMILDACDHVITSAADERHGLLSSTALKRSARNCLVLPGFAFSGYHPDMVYVHADGRVLPSATGEYHSRIAVAAYLAGLDVQDAVAMYNRLAFSRLGYFAVFEEQVALLCALWARHGVDLKPMLRRWAARGCFAYSINHPKIVVLLDIARAACAGLGLTPQNPDVDPATLHDQLARGAMHPVFPDIAAALGILPEGDFRAGAGDGHPAVLTAVDFVSNSFGRYAGVAPEALCATPGVPEALAALGLTLRIKPRGRLGRGTLLMTHHGTLLRQGPSRGQLSHAPVALAEWQAAYLRLAGGPLPARQTSTGLEGSEVLAASDKRRVLLTRNGAFLSADPHVQLAEFIRPAAAAWEHFLPLDDADLALLDRLAAADWLIEDTHETVWRQDIGIEAGPALRFGRWRIDLIRHFPWEVDGTLRLVLDGRQRSVHAQAPPAQIQAGLPEPGRTLGLVGAPVFLAPPIVEDAAHLDWMRRSAVAAQALDGAPQATQALLRRQADHAAAALGERATGLSVRFCGPDAGSAAGWADAAARLHVLAAIAPPDAAFLVANEIPEEALQAWRALGFDALTFRRTDPASGAADLLWLDNASIAELPAEALAGCRARIGGVPAAGRKLFWQTGILPPIGTVLRALGFETVVPDTLALVAGVARAANAGWIIGRTGQIPLVFCHPGTRIIELSDRAGFVQDDWVLSAKLGLRHAVLPCAVVRGEMVPDPDALMRLLALMADTA